MAARSRSRRRLKKACGERFRADFPREVFDYERRLRPRLAGALMRAGVTAIAAYGIGFGLGYFAWLRHTISDQAFFKLVWIFMIPSTVAALFIWLILKNRAEYPLRQEILTRMRDREQGDAPLWCYAPIVQALAPNDHALRQVLLDSREGRYEAIAPEDYCRTVLEIGRLLDESGERALASEVLAEVEDNLVRS